MAFTWIENENDPTAVGPKVTLGAFQAGATQAITKGQLLERTADTNSKWVPIDSDHDATSTKLAIANQNISSGDLAGFYEIIEFRPGDVFEADLAAASAIAPETALYYSSATAVTVTAGTNIIAYSTQGPNHPAAQKRLSQGQLGDSGTTFQSTNKVRLIFRTAVSTFSLKQRA
jgi:hypothetical protein